MTYRVLTYFCTYILMDMTYFLQHGLPRWNLIFTVLMFIQNWVITCIKWMVHWCTWQCTDVSATSLWPVFNYQIIHQRATNQYPNSKKIEHTKPGRELMTHEWTSNYTGITVNTLIFLELLLNIFNILSLN